MAEIGPGEHRTELLGYQPEHGKTYRYAVTAFDQTGNESDRSAPVEVVFP